MYHDQTTRPLSDLRWELMTLLAHGSFVTVVDKTAYDGWLDRVAYHRIGEAFHEAKAGRGSFAGRPLQDVAIYFSSRTRDWFGREQPANYFQAFQGAHQAMVLEHIPWGVVLDENATLERLKSFPVILLANVAILSEREAAVLRQYVEDGGALIVTGWTGVCGQRGEALERSAIESLIGARVIRRLESRDNHVRFTSQPGGSAESTAIRLDVEPDWPFLVEGPAVVNEPTSATAIGELLAPQRTVRQRQGKEGPEWPMSAGAKAGPAVLLNQIGKGRVLTLAGSPDVATSGEHRIVEARKLLASAVRALHPHPRLRIEAPAFVETVATDDPVSRQYRVHLIAYAPAPNTTPPKNRPYVLPGLIEDPPMYRARIHLSERPRSVLIGHKDARVEVKAETVEVLATDIHEVVTIEY